MRFGDRRGMVVVEHGVTSLGGIKPDEGAGKRRRPVEDFVPPVLSAEQAAAIHNLKPFLKAIADVNRLAILRELGREGSLGVLDLSDRLMLSQPLTSWHLHILKRARLVASTHLGRQRIYRLNRERLGEYKELFGKVIDL